MAAAAGFVSLLLGREVPATSAFHGQLSVAGTVGSKPLRKADIAAARAAGITTIVTYR